MKNNKIKKGSTLIESIVSLFIILIAASLLNTIVISTSKSIKYRNEENQGDSIAYAIENEIKYNITFDDLQKILNDNGEVSFKYTEDIMNKLLYTPLSFLEKGNTDKILIKKLDDNNKTFRVCRYNIKIYKDERLILSRDVIKSYWM